MELVDYSLIFAVVVYACLGFYAIHRHVVYGFTLTFSQIVLAISNVSFVNYGDWEIIPRNIARIVIWFSIFMLIKRYVFCRKR